MLDPIQTPNVSKFRSSMYLEKLQRLNTRDLRRVSRLEEQFQPHSAGSKSTKAITKLPHHHHRFECSEGELWYYYSEGKQSFCLLDFNFRTNGGGTKSYLLHDSQTDFPTSGLLEPTQTPDRRIGLVEKYQGLCRLLYTLSTASINNLLVYLFKPKTKRPLDLQWSNLTQGEQEIQEAIKLTIGLFAEREKNIVPWPTWSILNNYPESVAPIDIHFDRRVAIGEYLCRKSHDLSASCALFSDAIYSSLSSPEDSKWKIQLFHESAEIISLALKPKTNHYYGQFALFKTTSAFNGRDYRFDDFVTTCVQAEMACVLASMVERQKNSYYQTSNCYEQKSANALAAISRKFVLIHEFIVLTEEYFGRVSTNEETLEYLKQEIGIDNAECFALLSGFGETASILTSSISPANLDTDSLGVSESSRSLLHDDIMRVLSKLLELDSRQDVKNLPHTSKFIS